MRKYIKFIFTMALIFYSLKSRAQELSVSADAFGTLPEIQNIEISPDGSKLLMLQNYNGEMIIVTRSLLNLKEKTNGIPSLGVKYQWANWLSNDRILASINFTERSDGGKYLDSRTRLITMDWKGEKASRVNKRTSFLENRIVDILKDDPDHILMQGSSGAGNSSRESYFEVFKVNVNTQKQQKIFTGPKVIDKWITDKDHKIRLGLGFVNSFYISDARNIAYYRNNETSNWSTLYDVERTFGLGFSKKDMQKVPYRFESFSPNPDVIYISKVADNGNKSLYKYNVGQNKIVEKILDYDDYDFTGFSFDDEYNLEAAYYLNEKPQVIRFGERGKLLERIFKKNFPDSLVWIRSESEDKKKLIIKVTSPTDPGTFYYFDLDNMKMEMLGYNYQKVDIDKLSEMLPISYKTNDGLTIHGYLSLPKGSVAKNLPTIIIPSNGLETHNSWGFDYIVQFLTTRGYAVLQMNSRGSSGYGEDFTYSGFHEIGRKILDDINDGTKWLIDEGIADPRKICTLGVGNFSSYSALQVIVKDESLYKCTISYAPITNLDRYYRNVRTNYAESTEWTFNEASPIQNIDKINVPVLLMHGDLDKISELQPSQVFYKNMKNANKEIKYIEFEGGDYYLSKQEHRIQFLQEIEQFLAKHLLEQ